MKIVASLFYFFRKVVPPRPKADHLVPRRLQLLSLQQQRRGVITACDMVAIPGQALCVRLLSPLTMQRLPRCPDWLLSCGNETEDDTQPFAAFLLLSAIYSESTPPHLIVVWKGSPLPHDSLCAWMEWSSLHIWRGMRSTKWHESVRRRWEYFQQYQYCYWLAETEGRSLAHNSCYFVNNRYNGRIRNLDKHIFPIDNLLSLLYLCIDVASIAREADRIAREVRENDGHWRE